ncbi:hypothetical protein DFH06DRAFT_1441055 [Mycena polygramma]|nr:hypothetical protein DFH06DRAFT_1441055 [Mycena polygramma]
MGALDPILGAVLLGTWFASILYGIVLMEAWKYFTVFSDDSWTRKSLAMVTLAFCTAALVGDYGTAYLPMVTFWGNVVELGNALSLSSFANTILATIVDSYLIYRLHTLAKNLWITMFLYALLLLALGGYMVVFVLLVTGRVITERPTETIGAIINFITVAVVDLLTAVGLIWKLRSMRSNFAHTNTFLNRVMVGAVQTGSVTAMCSLLILVTFLNNPDDDVSTFFLFQFGPLYTLTLLFNFNLRRGPGSLASRTSESRTGRNTDTMRMDGIHVHRTAIVTMDPIDSVVDAAHRRLDDLEEVKHNNSDVESLSARNVKVATMKD